MRQTKRIAIGVVTALAAYLGFLAIVAALIVRGTIGESNMQTGIWISAFLAAFAGIKAGCRHKEIATVSICAAAILGTIILIGFLTNDGLALPRVAAAASAVAAGAAVALLTYAEKGKHKSAKRRFRK